MQAFLSCGEEWAQHRKVVPLTAERPLSRAVPKHFEYIAAEWGDDPDPSSSSSSSSSSTTGPYQQPRYAGLVHPVESSDGLDRDFCLDVVGGIFELDPIKMRRKMHQGAMQQQRQQKQQRKGAVGSHSNTQHTAPTDMILGESAVVAVASFKEKWSTFDWTQYVE